VQGSDLLFRTTLLDPERSEVPGVIAVSRCVVRFLEPMAFPGQGAWARL
jgi:hypothetical protein